MATASANVAAESAITITLTSLANGSWRQSAVVDNTSNEYIDGFVGGSIQVGTTPTDGGTIDIYAYGQWGGSGDYTAGASGSDAAYTADGEELLLKPVASIIVDATSDQDYVFGPIGLKQVFGADVLPVRFGLMVENNSGAALNATGTNNEIQFQGIKVDIA